MRGWLGSAPRGLGVRRVRGAPAALLRCTVFLALATLVDCGEQTTEPTGAPIATLTNTPAPTAAATAPLDDGYFHLSPEDLYQMLRDKGFLLINTHAPYGYEIQGTDASIPVDRAGQWLALYPVDRTAKIVLYCRSGQWSTVAARELVRAGYENVWHLDGGMVAWDRAGMPLVRP